MIHQNGISVAQAPILAGLPGAPATPGRPGVPAIPGAPGEPAKLGLPTINPVTFSRKNNDRNTVIPHVALIPPTQMPSRIVIDIIPLDEGNVLPAAIDDSLVG